jgi:hypothetical protein
MRFGAVVIRFAVAAELFTAPAPLHSVEARAPARVRAITASAGLPSGVAPQIDRSRLLPSRSESGLPPSALAIALACFGAASTRGTKTTRRSILGAAFAASVAFPRRASASYALYSASQASFDDRKKNNYVPVATNDRATLQSIQDDLNRKRPERTRKKVKAVYCAGNTSSVTPLLENACSEFGISKADQTTGNTIEEIMGGQTLPDYRRNLNN